MQEGKKRTFEDLMKLPTNQTDVSQQETLITVSKMLSRNYKSHALTQKIVSSTMLGANGSHSLPK